MTTTSRDALSRCWPLFGLRLATPRLTLRPVCDDDLAELVDLVLAGIHPSTRMPFLTPLTDASPDEVISSTLRHHWQARATSTPDNWSVHFAVRTRGTLIGIQQLSGRAFAVTRVVETAAWLGLAHQRLGFGREMCAAVLNFAFDHLRATTAESAAFEDDPASLGVSRTLGYLPNGVSARQRSPGEVASEQRLLVTAARFRRPAWDVQVAGLDACRGSFGV